VTLAYLAFATGASAAAPSQAPKCLQWQYHGGSQAQIAPRAEREGATGHAVSRAVRRAVSRKRAIQILVPIDVSIMAKNCRSIVSPSAGQNEGYAAAYSRPNAASDVPYSSRSKPPGTQYQVRRVWYQPRYPKLVANDNPRRVVAIEAVVTKSAQLPRARPDVHENPRDTRLMIKIGLLLGMGYVLFLTLWFWATRLRPRPTRPGRGIDTGRRIE
jgi:hypothetical protein